MPIARPKQFPRFLVAALLAANGLLWAVMFFGPLAHLERLAGGLTPFDIRPKGYSHDEARAFLEAIGEQGRRYYASPELVIDTVSVTARTANVRFTPECRHRETLLGCPLCAKSGHYAAQQKKLPIRSPRRLGQ